MKNDWGVIGDDDKSKLKVCWLFMIALHTKIAHLQRYSAVVQNNSGLTAPTSCDLQQIVL